MCVNAYAITMESQSNTSINFLIVFFSFSLWGLPEVLGDDLEDFGGSGAVLDGRCSKNREKIKGKAKKGS